MEEKRASMLTWGTLTLLNSKKPLSIVLDIMLATVLITVARRNLLVSKLGTNIAHIHILQGLMGLQITDLHHKWVRAIVLAVNKQLSHDNRMVGGATERSNPPLGGSQCGRVNGEGLIAGVPGGSGFETADVGSVAQLGLCVAADDFVFLSALEEQLVLLG